MNRSYSLKRHKEFRYTYARGRAQSLSLFTLVYVKSRNETVRVGFSVSKRIGNAVHRNRAKRRMRAALTPLLPRIAGGFNVIFVAKPEVLEAPFAELTQQMQTLLHRSGVWESDT
ncbi:MAG: ribonuclease P protein component [Clostridia bacterium]|nr:ribonuclease P protein component [Clostridia bacterium]